MSEDPVSPRASAGAAAVAPLVEAVGALRTAIEGLEVRADRARKNITGIVIAVVIDLIFTAGITIVYIGQEQTAASQAQTAASLADTRGEVLCPLYSVFLGSYNPATRAPGVDREAYESIYAQFRASYQHLNCTTPLVPKPTPTTNAPPPK